MATTWIARTTVIAALILATVACEGPAARPRILLLITVDTLRADHLGVYGGQLDLTPNLDALASESIVFRRAYTHTSFTMPSVSALLTGRYPEDLGVTTNRSALPPAVPTLATELADRGWHNAAVVSNFVLRRTSGLAVGFAHYDDALPSSEVVRRWPERTARDTTDALLDALDATAEESAPRFFWVHYQDPHGPYTPPPGLRERYLAFERSRPDGTRQLPKLSGKAGRGSLPTYQVVEGQREVAFYRAGYDAEVRHVDEEIGRLLRGLEERGVAGHTVVAFTADHGESLGEDDYWFAHGARLSEPLVRVPLMIRVPGRSAATRDDVAALVDLHPTLLNLAVGASVPDTYPGRDLLASDAEKGRSVPYLATLGAAAVARFGVIEGDYKLVIAREPEGWNPRLTRGGDGANLAAVEPRRLAALSERLERTRADLVRPPAVTRQKLTTGDLEKLRALGYVETPRDPGTGG